MTSQFTHPYRIPTTKHITVTWCPVPNWQTECSKNAFPAHVWMFSSFGVRLKNGVKCYFRRLQAVYTCPCYLCGFMSSSANCTLLNRIQSSRSVTQISHDFRWRLLNKIHSKALTHCNHTRPFRALSLQQPDWPQHNSKSSVGIATWHTHGYRQNTLLAAALGLIYNRHITTYRREFKACLPKKWFKQNIRKFWYEIVMYFTVFLV
jgi:hypothetical protein